MRLIGGVHEYRPHPVDSLSALCNFPKGSVFYRLIGVYSVFYRLLLLFLHGLYSMQPRLSLQLKRTSSLSHHNLNLPRFHALGGHQDHQQDEAGCRQPQENHA